MTSSIKRRRGLAVFALSLSCITGMSGATASAEGPESRSARSHGPHINGFSATDLGSQIRFRVNWCDYTPGTQYKITWRMFKGQDRVRRNRTYHTVSQYCNIHEYYFADTYANG